MYLEHAEKDKTVPRPKSHLCCPLGRPPCQSATPCGRCGHCSRPGRGLACMARGTGTRPFPELTSGDSEGDNALVASLTWQHLGHDGAQQRRGRLGSQHASPRVVQDARVRITGRHQERGREGHTKPVRGRQTPTLAKHGVCSSWCEHPDRVSRDLHAFCSTDGVCVRSVSHTAERRARKRRALTRAPAATSSLPAGDTLTSTRAACWCGVSV